MIEDGNYYGVLMRKVCLAGNVFFYYPLQLVEGTVENTEMNFRYFYDLYEKEYLLIADVDGEVDEDVVGFLINKDKVYIDPKKYKNTDEFKKAYYHAVENRITFGLFDIDRGEIDFLSVSIGDFGKIMSKIVETNPNTLNSGDALGRSIFDNKNSLLEYHDVLKNDVNVDDCIEKNSLDSIDSEYIEKGKTTISIFLTMKKLNELLELDANTLKDELCSYRDEFNREFASKLECEQNEEAESEDANDIFSRKIYDYIVSSKNTDLMLKCLEIIVGAYTDFIMHLDEELSDIDLEEKQKDEITDFYNQMILQISGLLSYKNLDLLKKSFMRIRNDYVNKVRKIEEIFDLESCIEEFTKNNKMYQLEKESLETILAENENLSKLPDGIFYVKDIEDYLNKRVIGQETAKRAVISSLFMNKLNHERKNKSSCLLIGPSGSGKTLIAETVAEYLDLPFIKVDSTQLSVPGYVGEDMWTFLGLLLEKANGNIEKAQNGIILFDEIDKKGSKENSDVSGRGVINNLLAFLEGTVYSVKYKNTKVEFDTHNLTVFATGAFTNVIEKLEKKANENSNIIGFNSSLESKEVKKVGYEKIRDDDLINEGELPEEFIGRWSSIVKLEPHTKESLMKIMTDSNVSALVEEKEALATVGINLIWEDEYVEAIADKAIEKKTGARSIKKIFEESIMDARYEAIRNLGIITSIILTKESVEDSQEAVLVYNDGASMTVSEVVKNSISIGNKVKKKLK